MEAVSILLSDARGIYIPRDFVQGFDVKAWGLDPEGWEVKNCQDPEGEFYWEAWQNLLDLAEYHKDGNVWRLYQDGDLFAICYELMTDEEKKNLGLDY